MLLVDCLSEFDQDNFGSEPSPERGKAFLIHCIKKEVPKDAVIDECDWVFLKKEIIRMTRTISRIKTMGRSGRASFVRDVVIWIKSKQPK